MRLQRCIRYRQYNLSTRAYAGVDEATGASLGFFLSAVQLDIIASTGSEGTKKTVYKKNENGRKRKIRYVAEGDDSCRRAPILQSLNLPFFFFYCFAVYLKKRSILALCVRTDMYLSFYLLSMFLFSLKEKLTAFFVCFKSLSLRWNSGTSLSLSLFTDSLPIS